MSKSEILLLDTHLWVWMVLGDIGRFSAAGMEEIERAAGRGNLRVSIMSAWEVGMLESKERIHLAMSCLEWVRDALATPGLSLAALTPEIAVESSRLPGGFHGDPVDRILVATARVNGITLLTRDQKILSYASEGHVMAKSA